MILKPLPSLPRRLLLIQHDKLTVVFKDTIDSKSSHPFWQLSSSSTIQQLIPLLPPLPPLDSLAMHLLFHSRIPFSFLLCLPLILDRLYPPLPFSFLLIFHFLFPGFCCFLHTLDFHTLGEGRLACCGTEGRLRDVPLFAIYTAAEAFLCLKRCCGCCGFSRASFYCDRSWRSCDCHRDFVCTQRTACTATSGGCHFPPPPTASPCDQNLLRSMAYR